MKTLTIEKAKNGDVPSISLDNGKNIKGQNYISVEDGIVTVDGTIKVVLSGSYAIFIKSGYVSVA